jgi:hypothetical protein
LHFQVAKQGSASGESINPNEYFKFPIFNSDGKGTYHVNALKQLTEGVQSVDKGVAAIKQAIEQLSKARG